MLTAILGHSVPCRADLVIEAPNLTNLAPGSSGSFDVLLVNTNPAGGLSYDVAADSLGLSLVCPLERHVHERVNQYNRQSSTST